MPIYEYVCPECEIKFDRLQPTGSAQAQCPHCGMPSKKAISLFAAFVATGDAPQRPWLVWEAVRAAPAGPALAADSARIVLVSSALREQVAQSLADVGSLYQ